MSTFNLANYLEVTPDGDHFNIWDAPFRDIHLRVPTSRVITIDASTQANLPGIAAEYLGSRYLWWALLFYNGITDPISGVYSGLILKVPDREALLVYLENRRSLNSAGNFLPNISATVL